MRASLLLVVGATAVAGWVLPRASPRTRARARSRDGESRTPFGSLRRAVQNATTWEFVPPWQFIGGAAVGIAISAGVLILPSATLSEPIRESTELFETVLETMESSFVDEVDVKRLFNTGVSAMLRTLDPYTELEPPQAARDLKESVSGRYGGVGLVIASDRNPPSSAAADSAMMSTLGGESRQSGRGTIVVGAFEGYAYDSGMRVGDHLLAIDGKPISQKTVDEVRDLLRGLPDTLVRIEFLRDGGGPPREVTLRRQLVRLQDVRLATLLEAPYDRVGYVQLSGFSQDAAKEVRETISLLEQETASSHGGLGLRGLILDLRGNPGGLLSSAVDVASALVPRGSTLVSAQGRGFPRVMYLSDTEPLRDPEKLPLAVIVNGGTASAAEIVSGAVQDLDTGVIVGAGRTFGKGLVQNVEELPYSSALKYTVGRYFTPSGRCIQAVTYRAGGAATGTTPTTSGDGGADGESEDRAPIGDQMDESAFRSDEIPESARRTFRTAHGREVRDGGGIEPDLQIAAAEVSPLSAALASSGAMFDFAGQWAKSHDLSRYLVEPSRVQPTTMPPSPEIALDGSEHDSTTRMNRRLAHVVLQGPKLARPVVDDSTFAEFRRYVEIQRNDGKFKLESSYTAQLRALEDASLSVSFPRDRDRARFLSLVLAHTALTDEFLLCIARPSRPQSGLPRTARAVRMARETLSRELSEDFAAHSAELRQELELAILSRYLPESQVLRLAFRSDAQLDAAAKIVSDRTKYDALLSSSPAAAGARAMNPSSK